MTKHQHLCLSFASALALSLPSLAPAQSPQTKRIEAMADAYHEWGLFHGTVLVAKHDEILFQKAYGLASVKDKTPNKIDTVYPIASLSKQFTAMALLRLYEQGKVDLSQEISKYIPDLKDSIAKRITIQQIMQHRAGLRRDLFTGTDLDSNATYTLADLIVQINTTELQSEPGKKRSYSNIGYVLLAAIIEGVSEQSYADAMQGLLFEPLEMHHTGHAICNDGIDEIAAGHTTLVDEIMPAPILGRSAALGGGSLHSTVGDLHRWTQELMKPRVLTKKSVAMLQEHRLGVVTYQYSWPDRKESEPKGRVLFHGGATDGYASILGVYFEHDLTVIALSNNQPAWTNDLFNQLINIPLGFKEGKPTRNLTRTMYRALFSKGIDAAEEIWREADAEDAPDKPGWIVMNRTGYNFLAFDRFAEAVKAFELFVRVKPKNANAWDSLGESYAVAGRRKDAIRAYEKSLSLNPNNGGAVTMLKKLKAGE